MNCGEDIAEELIPNQETIELMSVNRQVTQIAKAPLVLLIDLYPYQMRHHIT
jgi:hypothetical protein